MVAAALISLLRSKRQWASLVLWCCIAAARLQPTNAAFLFPATTTTTTTKTATDPWQMRIGSQQQQQQQQILYKRTKHAPTAVLRMSSYDTGNEYGDDETKNNQVVEGGTSLKKKKTSRWDSLNPRVKARIVKTGQERAIANKQKRESPQTKKRRESLSLSLWLSSYV